MTLEQQEKLRKLAEDECEKRLVFQRWQMTNIYGLTMDEHKKVSVANAIAQAELFKASSKLRKAIDAFNL